MTYEQALAYIHSVYWRGSKLGLARITELLRRMGDPQKKLRFLHVAGTNGKGSVCAILAAVLRAQGYRTGLYTSPYIERFNERMQIDGQPIPDGELAQLTDYVRGFAESMDSLPTEFEIVCAVAFAYFAQNGCDIVVLEVGLGGRLDATNVIDSPLCAVVTAIDYDHTEYLGETLAAIAAEKAGIIKAGTAVVSYEQPPEALAVLEQRCAAVGATLAVSDFSRLVSRVDSLDGQVFDYKDLRGLKIRLLGAHQQRNAAVAVDTVEALNGRGLEVSEQALRQGLESARWPGRFELLRRDPVVVVDGGHNAQGAAAAAAAVKTYLGGRAILLVGLLADKDRASMLTALDTVAGGYVATSPPNPRALDADVLAKELAAFEKPVVAAPDLQQACAAALGMAAQTGLPVLAVGSLYMVGDIRRYFLNKGEQG